MISPLTKRKTLKKNPKKTWSIVNEVTGRKRRNQEEIGEINQKNDPKEKAEEFNKHYSKVPENLAIKIPNPKKSFESYMKNIETTSKMAWKPVNAFDIERIIKNMEAKWTWCVLVLGGDRRLTDRGRMKGKV